MKIYDKVGCSINDPEMTEQEFKRFEKVGWMKEEDYKRLHEEDFKQ